MIARNILEELGLNRLPSEKQEEVLAQISHLIYQGVLIRALERMGEVSRREFEHLLGSEPDDSTIASFLERNVPDLDNLIEEEVSRFRQEMNELLTSHNQKPMDDFDSSSPKT